MGELKDLRCEKCGRLLAHYILDQGYISIKCPECGELLKLKLFKK